MAAGFPTNRASTDQTELERLLRGRTACVTICTPEEDYAVDLCREAALALNRPLCLWSAASGVHNGLLSESPIIANTESPIAALGHIGELTSRPIAIVLDLAAHLENARVLRTWRNAIRRARRTGTQLILIDHSDQLPAIVRAESTPLELSLPDDKEIETLVRHALRAAHRAQRIEVAIDKPLWATLLRNLRGLSRRQITQIASECVSDDRRLDADDLNHVLAAKRKALVQDGLLEFVEAPVTLDDIGGLASLKHWLSLRRDTLDDRARSFGLTPPRGVLMLGVQGAGKSLCAKAIATAWQRPLLRMDVGALYDKYVGETERRLRGALHQAERMAPIVLWIDEIEKAFASAAAQSTDGGLSKRMFGALLTWMQDHEAPVFLVATANDIEALPPELMRKGRFDEIFFVDLPDENVRAEIFAIHLRRRGRQPRDFDLAALARAADGFSGAEIEQAVISALHTAFGVDQDLTTDHLLAAVRESPPLSVTMAERVAHLRDWASGRCKPAN